MSESQDQRQAWIAEAEAMRARLGTPGVAEREQLRAYSGAEFLNGISTGALPAPPIGELMGMTPISIAPGVAGCEGTPEMEDYSPGGVVHGG